MCHPSNHLQIWIQFFTLHDLYLTDAKATFEAFNHVHDDPHERVVSVMLAASTGDSYLVSHPGSLQSKTGGHRVISGNGEVVEMSSLEGRAALSCRGWASGGVQISTDMSVE